MSRHNLGQQTGFIPSTMIPRSLQFHGFYNFMAFIIVVTSSSYVD